MISEKIKLFLLLQTLSANPTKWSNTLKQFVRNFPTNCMVVFDHFVKLPFKGLNSLKIRVEIWRQSLQLQEKKWNFKFWALSGWQTILNRGTTVKHIQLYLNTLSTQTKVTFDFTCFYGCIHSLLFEGSSWWHSLWYRLQSSLLISRETKRINWLQFFLKSLIISGGDRSSLCHLNLLIIRSKIWCQLEILWWKNIFQFVLI